MVRVPSNLNLNMYFGVSYLCGGSLLLGGDNSYTNSSSIGDHQKHGRRINADGSMQTDG
jgi:hypothetical protein